MSANQHDSIFQTGFFSHIILPTLLTICLFVITLFFLLIPAIETIILDRKREMTRELVNTAWSVLEELEAEESQGQLTRQEAQQRAIARIGQMRYGDERKDYFWITDMQPTMIVHPYRPELNGQDMTSYEDPSGKRLFVECVRTVSEDGEGFVDYMWQWKDDESRIVPKLSFVKGFEPWNWIIGTGIYLEDVKEEISSITRWFLVISLSITAIISLLLAFVAYQSLTIEKRRRQAESRLRDSREKYKSLVEATTEGLVMIVEDCVFFANQKFLDMLGYRHDEIERTPFCNLVPAEALNGADWKEWIDERSPLPQFPSQLVSKSGQPIDVMLSTSSISFSERDAVILIAKDITVQPTLEAEGENRSGGYETLAQRLDLGLIRAFAGKKGAIIAANPAAAALFGYDGPDELRQVPVTSLVTDESAYDRFLDDMQRNGSIAKRILHIKRKDGQVRAIRLSAIACQDKQTGQPCFDAMIDDVTERQRIEQEQERIVAELQSCLLSLNQPIRNFIRDAVFCPLDASIQQAVELMSRNHSTALVIQSEAGEAIGIVTDSDIRERVLSEGLDSSASIATIMSAPLAAVSERALIHEAATMMRKKSIQHLAAKASDGSVCGVITGSDLLQFHHYSTAVMIQTIENAKRLDDVFEESRRLPLLVKSLIDSGANAQSITRTITTVSDAVLYKVCSVASDEIGPPPVPFALIALGSEGREEQTLFTDQDNAILFDDVPEKDFNAVQAYFLQYGERICTDLNRAGYAFCKGGVMAMNSKWCQPLSVWKRYFSDWIQNADPQALLDLKIFFDYRCMIGEEAYVEELTGHIHRISRDRAAFFHHLAANTLLIKPPLGLFGNIVAKSKDGRPESFDIKEAMLPLVDFARIYALQNGIRETNTLERLRRIAEHGALTSAGYTNALRSYECLMQIRLKHQAEAIVSEQPSDNQIDPKSLSDIEHVMVKKALAHISDLQTKMSYDFTGTAS